MQVIRPRNYDGAKSGRLTSDWITSEGTGDKHIRQDVKTLRERARDFERNDGYAEGVLTEFESNIIGEKGIAFKPMARKKDARTSGGTASKIDALACEKIKQAWDDFSKAGQFEVTRQMSRAMYERLCIRSMVRDGGFLTRFVDGFPKNDFRFAVQGFETDLLDPAYNDPSKRIFMSVEFDEWDGPERYHLLKGDAKRTLLGYRSRDRFPVEAKDLIHLFAFRRLTQSQGVSWFSPIMTRLRHLTKYEEAEVIAARIGANKVGFFESDGESQYEGDTDAEGNIKAPSGPGEWETLPPGVKANLIDPKHPNANYPEFRKANLRGVAAGLYLNYNSLAKDLEGVNFSSIRQGVLSERDIWRMIQSVFIDLQVAPIFDRWLRMALLTGKIEGLSPLDYDRLRFAEFSGRTWSWVDPMKDVQAAREEILLGINSRQSVARDRGKDFAKILGENEEDQSAMDSAGVAYEKAGQDGSAVAQNSEEDPPPPKK